MIARLKLLLTSVVQIIGIGGLPIIKAEDNIAELICYAIKRQGVPIKNGDILAVTHIIVSCAEGKELVPIKVFYLFS